MIVGIDEVGRGCLAGPVCVGAVALTRRINGLADSKLLTFDRRTVLAQRIKERAVFVSLGWATHEVIDQYGLTAALRLAAAQAIAPFSQEITQILLDGNHNYIGDKRVKTIIGGDNIEPVISAASIVAKVARDNYMHIMHVSYPQYGFNSHVGYATLQHRTAIVAHGPSMIHRQSFALIKKMAYGA